MGVYRSGPSDSLCRLALIGRNALWPILSPADDIFADLSRFVVWADNLWLDAKYIKLVTKMDLLTPAAFEAELDTALSSGELTPEDQTVLASARRRLDQNPELRKGEVAGAFTYSDQTLEQALYTLRLMNNPNLFELSRAGHELKGGPKELARWIKVLFAEFRNRHHKSLIQLAARHPANEIVLNRPQARIAVVGDAGFKGQAQARVLQMILNRHNRNHHSAFDVILHLGDVYFAGSSGEMVTNFLGPFRVFQQPPVVPVYTLVGNHDLYYGGESFLHALDDLRQPGRYFLIDTPAWRIICLDTSLADGSWGRLHGRLDDDQLTWLQTSINQAGTRRVIVMSHHYYVSAWKPAADSLREQLEHLFRDKIFAWYWGHEHGCATYGRGANGFYGACVGNGSFREKWTQPEFPGSGSPSWYADGRCNCYQSASDDWPHGFLELELCSVEVQAGEWIGTEVRETYHLENGSEKQHPRTLRVD
jgi:hypothetical protein